MSNLPKKILESDDVELRYANWLRQVVDMISPKDLYLYLGRAAGKTTDFVAERLQDIVYDMPGAFIAVVADTYMNAMKNILPSLMEGLARKGWIEGIHYVKDKRPPDKWGKPYKPVFEYKHTITFFNGVHLKIVSMDRPSTGAGDSYQHLLGDESKYLKKKKLDKLIPAIRGEYLRFHHSPYYRGRTFTSDLANPADNEDDWMMEMAKEMKADQIILILQVAKQLNAYKLKFLQAKQRDDKKAMKRLQKYVDKWEDRWRKVR
ncbi:MAG: hypothetical protein LAT81_08825, partial [Oceanicaulis sp.]|nr:hypothetical protein [Oceanicaulis sp.]